MGGLRKISRKDFSDDDVEAKDRKPRHADFERNKSDAMKLKEFWEPKLKSHKSSLIIITGADTLYLSYKLVSGGRQYPYSSPHTYSQPWPEFRGSVTDVFRYCEVLGAQDDRNASGEWNRKFGIRVTPKENSYAELFLS